MNFTELLESEGWKKFMAKLYGLGAAVVIIGALFKIMHWPGAGPMLVLGLSTEAVIFFFSAFEPLHEEDDWSLVFPQLAGLSEDEANISPVSVGGSQGGGLSEIDKLLLKNIESGDELFEKLGQGLENLTKTAGNLSNISDATVATAEYTSNIRIAAESASVLSSTCKESSENLSESSSNLVSAYLETADQISKTGGALSSKMNRAGTDLASNITHAADELASQLTQASSELVGGVAKSGQKLAQTYTNVATSIAKDAELINNSNTEYGIQLENLNKNLTALNAVYQLQLENSNERMQTTSQLYQGIDSMMDSLKKTAVESQVYQQEFAQLGKKLQALNNVYGKMLSAMNINA